MGYDHEKIISCMFDPVTSGIIAGLEGGPRELSDLAGEAGMAQEDVLERLSYLMRHGFVARSDEGGRTVITADGEKLAAAVEGSDSFDGAVDGLATMDSYLN